MIFVFLRKFTKPLKVDKIRHNLSLLREISVILEMLFVLIENNTTEEHATISGLGIHNGSSQWIGCKNCRRSW